MPQRGSCSAVGANSGIGTCVDGGGLRAQICRTFRRAQGCSRWPRAAQGPGGRVVMRIEYHRTLLADRVRDGAFFAALKQRVVPGTSTVADIGAGTGFLGFLAAGLGAKRVDLYEAAEIAALARKLIRCN